MGGQVFKQTVAWERKSEGHSNKGKGEWMARGWGHFLSYGVVTDSEGIYRRTIGENIFSSLLFIDNFFYHILLCDS